MWPLFPTLGPARTAPQWLAAMQLGHVLTGYRSADGFVRANKIETAGPITSKMAA